MTTSYAVQVHARNKPIDRSGDAEHEEDALLHRVAALAVGYSGAELANLLNESAILAVCRLQVSQPPTPDVTSGSLCPCSVLV
jgi:ATP-dependent Zn protease